MKLLLFVCVCALVAAEPQPGVPSTPQLAGVLTNLYRRFLHTVAPKQLELQDALDIKWSDGFLAGPAFYSPINATFDGKERTAFSFINFLINPGQAGHLGQGSWVKNDVSEVVFMYHYGAAVKVHLISEDGSYRTEVMGNPLDHKGSRFLVYVPRATYSVFESLSGDEATFHSYIDIPAWSREHHQEFSAEEMATTFPQHAQLFHHLAKPGHHGHTARR
ncbi:uncharacterized protein LOC122375744 [Amphibalanus amphitrite]|uniref:uncharacterized protein LOC122375744 n=1 Tax=Amphibalanus amphitrite TaxID=1232801 RepID=UPI001C9262C5|nr:uncharacterized protein LOC122375744 [Amphibalanus amphitrite]